MNRKRQSGSVPDNATPSTTDAATVFTLARGQLGFIQNLGTTPLGVKLGTSPSTTSFSFILAAGAANDDGKGDSCYLEDYLGPVTVIALSGSPRYLAWKRQVG